MTATEKIMLNEGGEGVPASSASAEEVLEESLSRGRLGPVGVDCESAGRVRRPDVYTIPTHSAGQRLLPTATTSP